MDVRIIQYAIAVVLSFFLGYLLAKVQQKREAAKQREEEMRKSLRDAMDRARIKEANTVKKRSISKAHKKALSESAAKRWRKAKRAGRNHL